jgi:hypothetical protein
MIAVIQDISLRWTKQSRSAEGATARRAAARDRFPVSEVSDVGPPPGSSVGAGRPEASPAAGLRLLRHHVSLAEEDGFRPMHGGTWDDWPDGKVHRMPGLAIRVTRNAVEVTWAWEWSCGAPERSSEPRLVLTVRPGCWSQAQWNCRYTTLAGLDGWKYEERTVNIGLFEELPDSPFSGEPARRFRAMADLR